MNRILLLGSLVLFLSASIGVSGPIGGGWAKKIEVGNEAWKDTKRFRGGERATVLVAGNNHAPGGMQISIYDAGGNLVAQENGIDPPVADILGVTWYPPRAGEYRIEVKNLGTSPNSCYITIK